MTISGLNNPVSFHTLVDVSNEHPSVAVVIPCWNAEKWVSVAIQSVLDQEYPCQLIVIDDGSSDQTLSVVRAFGDRLICETGPNRGANHARNRGLEIAAAEYVIFLDADDYLERGALKTWCLTAKNLGADVLLGPWVFEKDGKRVSGWQPSRPLSNASILGDWLTGNFVPPCSVLWRRDFLQSIGGWRLGCLRNQDGELVMRALIIGANVEITHDGLGVYVHHDSLHRVSRRLDRDSLVGDLGLLEELFRLAVERPINVSLSFGLAYYQLAYNCFANSVDDVGADALNKARCLGVSGHPGSQQHRILASLLGLRRKLRLTSVLRRR